MDNLADKARHFFKKPYKDDHGINLIKLINRETKTTLPSSHGIRMILKWSKLSSYFDTTDDANK